LAESSDCYELPDKLPYFKSLRERPGLCRRIARRHNQDAFRRRIHGSFDQQRTADLRGFVSTLCAGGPEFFGALRRTYTIIRTLHSSTHWWKFRPTTNCRAAPNLPTHFAHTTP
jgi:hypothetical protein